MDKNKIELEIEPILSESGFELVDLKISRQQAKLLLQFFIDKKEGVVGLDDCGLVSDKIGAYLDMNDALNGSGYILEVSSPGVDRVIKKEKDFVKFAGEKVKIKLKKPVNGARVYYASLLGCENGDALFSDGLRFNLADIEEVRLNPGDSDIFKKHN